MSIKKNQCGYQKTQNFHADFESVEKVLKKCTKKVISKNIRGICTIFTFTNVRQTCFAYNLFLVHFLTTFSMNSKSAQNYAFLISFLIFSKNLVILALFENFEAKRAKNG
jgi:hypothetical protein